MQHQLNPSVSPAFIRGNLPKPSRNPKRISFRVLYQHLLTHCATPQFTSPLGWFSTTSASFTKPPLTCSKALHNVHNLHTVESAKVISQQRFKSKKAHLKKLAAYA
jgi:hypothetical protein